MNKLQNYSKYITDAGKLEKTTSRLFDNIVYCLVIPSRNHVRKQKNGLITLPPKTHPFGF
jgi:hypothetical protein